MTSKLGAPLIGLTTYGRNAENRYTLPSEYVDAVRRARGVPVLLPPGDEHGERLVAAIDALVLTGGGDIEPQHYGSNGHATNYGMDAERDRAELAIARWAVDTGLPTLGICRGAQILNVMLGGTLVEHIPDAVGESVLHRAPQRLPVPHRVTVRPDSRLARIVGSTEFEVASWHHQALGKVAAPFATVAHAPDGTIEAVEIPEHPWLIAVQWHPELSAASDRLHQRLFDGLVKAGAADKRP
ncbi:MAG: gamma-glutamyl-gamma-aminobutyrate hydrolase family protein [Gammaproteobacteria bacterium]